MSEREDTILIEADTIGSALETLTERYGSEATIVSAERVRKGGVAGFFATEVVELVAIPPRSGHQPEPESQVSGRSDAGSGAGAIGGVNSVFARMLESAEQAETDLGVGAHVAVLEKPEAEQPTTPAVSTEANAPRSPVNGIRWDVPRLIEIGLPGSLIEDLMHLDPDDDIGHIERLAQSVAPLIGAMPAEPHRMIGTREARHSEHLDFTDRARPVHLVLARGDELDVTKPPPAIVSWTDDGAAPTAIAVAWQTGATLGWSISGEGTIRRVTAVDAALAIRHLLETV